MFSNLSALNENSKGRLYDVTPDHRLPYERDRDRIYHSTAFRKLKDKTQVFMFEKGDSVSYTHLTLPTIYSV